MQFYTNLPIFSPIPICKALVLVAASDIRKNAPQSNTLNLYPTKKLPYCGESERAKGNTALIDLGCHT